MGLTPKPTRPPQKDVKESGESAEVEGYFESGFTVSRWTQVPKEVEEPELEFLAKRREGLPLTSIGAQGPSSNFPQLRKTRVRRVDEDGVDYIYEVLVPEGTSVEGEVVEGEEATMKATAPGTVIQGVGIANAEGVVVAREQAVPTPPRRRPRPPKRRAKGPSKGRKKRPAGVPELTISHETVSTKNTEFGDMSVASGAASAIDHAAESASNRDVEMGDDSVLQDGGNSDNEDYDAEEGEEGDREEGELSPTPEPDVPESISGSPLKASQQLPTPIIATGILDSSTTTFPDMAEARNRELSSSPDVPLAAISSSGLSNVVEAVSQNPPVWSPQLNLATSVNLVAVEYHQVSPVARPESTTGNMAQDDLAVPKEPESEPLSNSTEAVGNLFGSLEKHLQENS
jgi:hypothetical protein